MNFSLIKLILNPCYWPIWLGAGLLFFCAQLPFRCQIAMGRILGRMALPFAHHRRHVTETNLRLCFPTISEAELKKRLNNCFESAGIGMFETAMAWWMSTRRFKKLFVIEGLEHLEKALEKKHGALILAAHFTTLEVGGRILSLHIPYNGVYREHKNPAFQFIMHHTREKHIHQAIARNDVKQFLKSFKKNMPIFYVADQDYGRKHSVFVPFFGINAATITGTSRIAKISKTSVLPYFVYRREDNSGYTATIFPALENYPTDDPYKDALRINKIVEQAILKSPDQYLWQHRRFKTRPEGETGLY